MSDEPNRNQFWHQLMFELDDGRTVRKGPCDGQSADDEIAQAVRIGVSSKTCIEGEVKITEVEIIPWHRVRRLIHRVAYGDLSQEDIFKPKSNPAAKPSASREFQ